MYLATVLASVCILKEVHGYEFSIFGWRVNCKVGGEYFTA